VGNDEDAKKLFNEILKREPTYIGSYYHLGKLLERIGDPAKALKVYERGMEVATTADDHRSYTELRVAYEDLEDILEN
jgi:tetratricopeptide (TPR) repeat protein